MSCNGIHFDQPNASCSQLQALNSAYVTPLRCWGNVFVKMEAWQPASSHKARAARYMINDALAKGQLTANGSIRIIEKSGGNLGVGLAYAAAQKGIAVDLVIGLSFSRTKKALCEQFGARVIKEDWLRDHNMTPKEVIHALLEQPNHNYFFTDQFANQANAAAHLQETGPEFVAQIQPLIKQDQRIILVKGAGTGASFNGIISALKAFSPNVSSFLVVPEGCDVLNNSYIDHKLEGFCVGVRPPFLDLSTVDEQFFVSDEKARAGQQMMAKTIGFYPGMTSGANYFAATQIAAQNPDAAVLTLAYDSGESYLTPVLSSRETLTNHAKAA